MSGWAHKWMLVAGICLGVLLLTELTSNTGTAATFLPIIGAIAISLGEKPLTASHSNGTRRQLLFHDACRHFAQRHRLCQWATDSGSDGQGRLAFNLLARPVGGSSGLVFGPWVFGIR